VTGTRPAKAIEVLDVQVGGDVHRIVISGVKELPGKSVREQSDHLRLHADGLRQFLLNEPRGGHPSLFADLIVKSSHPKANAGFIIMESMGYPLFSGTNTISTVHALLETGMIAMEEGRQIVCLEAPFGLVEVVANCKAGRVRNITFTSEAPSFLSEKGLNVIVESYGTIEFDLAWAGVFYPIIDADVLGFSLVKEEAAELTRFSSRFVESVRRKFQWSHPELGNPGPPSFALLARAAQRRDKGLYERRISTYVHPSTSVCRSPAGTATMAAAAQLASMGEMKAGDEIIAISPFNTTLQGKIIDMSEGAIIISITGESFTIARSYLPVDEFDPLTPDDGLFQILDCEK